MLMTKLTTIVLLCSLAGLAPAQNGRYALGDYLDSLSKAKTLSVDYTVQTIGGTREAYSVTLQKPNKFRLQSPSETVIGDGTTIYRFDAASQKFTKRAQVANDLGRFFAPIPFRIWGAFFDPGMAKVPAVRDLGVRTRLNTEYRAVEAQFGRGITTYYLDAKANIARQFEYQESPLPNMIVVAQDIKLSGDVPATKFAFDPKTAKGEIPEVEYDSPKWSTDLVAAVELARKTKRKVFVDFFVPKDPTSAKLDKEVYVTPRFKAFENRLVFVRVDVMKNPKVAGVYAVTTFPTQLILDDKGEEVDNYDKYEGAIPFFDWLSEALRLPLFR
jgi:hypothetical protein